MKQKKDINRVTRGEHKPVKKNSEKKVSMHPPNMMPPMPPGVMKVPSTQKFDFPMEVQIFFKNKNIGHVRSDPPKKCRRYDSVFFNRPDILDGFEKEAPPKPPKAENREERAKRLKKEKKKEHRRLLKELSKQWNPFADERLTTDPYKTLFVGHLNYETTEKKLQKEFEQFGNIVNLRIVRKESEDEL